MILYLYRTPGSVVASAPYQLLRRDPGEDERKSL